MVVLSNNDDFLVSRTAEAKALGLGDLVPYFQVEAQLRKHNVAVFSSNYRLYGDLSNRVINTLRAFSPDIEVYSIDEMFLDVTGLPLDLPTLGHTIKATVWQHTRIPVGGGVAPTKTLAKLANRGAKTTRWTDLPVTRCRKCLQLNNHQLKLVGLYCGLKVRIRVA